MGEEQEKWYFSIIDTIETLTATDWPRKYWSDLKAKLKKEGSELSEKIGQLKMAAEDGKMRMTDVADTEQLFRLIQSIPSPKAEPFKLWLAKIASERLDEIQDPELSIDRALQQYLNLGYSENWINQRLKSIEIRKELTDEWKKRGLKEGVQFATLPSPRSVSEKKRPGVAPRTGTNKSSVALLSWINPCSSKSENHILKRVKFTFGRLPSISGNACTREAVMNDFLKNRRRNSLSFIWVRARKSPSFLLS